MDTSSPSSSSKMLTDCLDKSESCRSTEHRVNPHTSTNSVKIALCLLMSLLQTSLGAIVLLQNGIFFLLKSQIDVCSVENMFSARISPVLAYRTMLRVGSTVLLCIQLCPLRGAVSSPTTVTYVTFFLNRNLPRLLRAQATQLCKTSFSEPCD